MAPMQQQKSIQLIMEERGLRVAEVRKLEAENEKKRLEMEEMKLQAVIQNKLPASVLETSMTWGNVAPSAQAPMYMGPAGAAQQPMRRLVSDVTRDGQRDLVFEEL